ncbi:MAG TPA: hypothetical protein VK188_09185 [Holophaga sp.]|nr:hypothetical protein [Holophaga sp.]
MAGENLFFLFLGILGLLGASAMGFSMGVSARVIFASAADRKNHRRDAEKAEVSEEKILA